MLMNKAKEYSALFLPVGQPIQVTLQYLSAGRTPQCSNVERQSVTRLQRDSQHVMLSSEFTPSLNMNMGLCSMATAKFLRPKVIYIAYIYTYTHKIGVVCVFPF